MTGLWLERWQGPLTGQSLKRHSEKSVVGFFTVIFSPFLNG
ncbi:hypothetical protein BGP_4530 [Beggiatoa sp. PS]|nr:hypothetical protein BGP_4530 [Beggiatoa sp. PS]